MAQADYHYIENYSNVGKIGISYAAMGEMLKECIKDIKHVTISKNITFFRLTIHINHSKIKIYNL